MSNFINASPFYVIQKRRAREQGNRKINFPDQTLGPEVVSSLLYYVQCSYNNYQTITRAPGQMPVIRLRDTVKRVSFSKTETR